MSRDPFFLKKQRDKITKHTATLLDKKKERRQHSFHCFQVTTVCILPSLYTALKTNLIPSSRPEESLIETNCRIKISSNLTRYYHSVPTPQLSSLKDIIMGCYRTGFPLCILSRGRGREKVKWKTDCFTKLLVITNSRKLYQNILI